MMQCFRRTLLLCALRRAGTPAYFIPLRHLSVSETSAALRPFYFAVHPDLFGQYPQARAVNEQSLKQLNEYLDNIHVRQRASPQTLLFYLRDTNPIRVATTPTTEGHFKAVRIALLSCCPRETVTSVLRSCNFSLDYVNSVQPGAKGSKLGEGNRPIKWDQSFYSFWGIPNPDEPRKPRVDDTLSIWFRQKLQTCRMKMLTFEPIRAQAESLRQHMISELGVTDVTWACGWGVTPFRACLQGLARLQTSHPNTVAVLRGHRVVFGTDTGMCIRGNVVLRHDDVPMMWLPLFQCLHKHEAILNKIPAAEKHLSSHLHGANIVSNEVKSVIMAVPYLHQIRKMSKSLRDYKASHPDHQIQHESLEDVRMIFECTQGSLQVTTEGQIYVPASCPMFLLIDFINKHANEAKQKYIEYKLQHEEMKRLMAQVKSSLQLASLTCDNNISHAQLAACLQRLLLDSEIGDIDLYDCRLNISHFYSIMSDGEMYIPWNWRGWMDD